MRQGFRRRGVAVAFVVGLVLPTAAQADPPTYETGFIPVAVGTPDETTLHYKVMLPNPTAWGPGPYPAVVDYSGYRPAITIFDGLDDRFRAAGYAVVGINIRGTSCSGGQFDYFEPLQSRDGRDALEWLAENRGADDPDGWSNGDFGMVGKSYPGITQLFVAAQRPASLRAIVPGHVFADLYRDVPFPGGILNLTFAAGWSMQRNVEAYLVGPQYALGIEVESEPDPAASDEVKQRCLLNQLDHVPNIAINPFVQATYNQYDGPLFHERSPWYFAEDIDVPTFLVESWQDEQVGSRATHLLERLRADEIPWKFIASNGDHGEYYGPDMFPHILRFLSFHLKGETPTNDDCEGAGDGSFGDELACYEAENPVIVNWENGAGGGRIAAYTTTHADWPPPNQEAWRLNLRPDGSLTEEAYAEVPELSQVEILNARTNGAIDYLYVPEVGSQERGGFELLEVPAASWTDRPPDGTFAAFTTDPLSEDRVLLGPASLDLWITSTAPDTDFEVTLTEVRPDGQEVFVQQGWLRASHRMEDSLLSTELRPYQTHRLTDSSLLLPGQPTKIRIEIFPFGHVFREGSRLRIWVAAPHLHPDLWGFLMIPVPAVNTIFASEIFPSSLALPLLAGDTPGVAGYPPCTLRNQPCRPEPAE